MLEETLQVFIESILHYFKQLNDNSVRVGTPYLMDNGQPAAFDITGIIGISGPHQGCVYFTAPRILLKHVLIMLGETDTSSEHLLDLVGEVANTLSGNARSYFGQQFMISVPVMVEGPPDHIHLPKHLRSYVIPIYWKNYQAAVVICLKE